MSRSDDDIAMGEDEWEELFPVAEAEEWCSPGCGYRSSGQDLSDHWYWEHRECGDCGAKPRDGDSLTHRLDCPRLQPGYGYPDRGAAELGP